MALAIEKPRILMQRIDGDPASVVATMMNRIFQDILRPLRQLPSRQLIVRTIMSTETSTWPAKGECFFNI